MTIHQRVYVELGNESFHVSGRCPSGARPSHWCSAAAAHRSRLSPCKNCAGDLSRELRAALGSIPSGARKGLGLPTLQTVSGRAEREPSALDHEDPDIAYGPPESLDDPRFASRSRADWGTAFYGQDPDEFLGGPTDDDNDWRGGSSMYD